MNWFTLTFVLSVSDIAPKEDDAEIASDNKSIDVDKTHMGKISQNMVIWRPL